jgi:hypothetical protein
VDETPESLLHLSVITIGEVRKGIDVPVLNPWR